MRRQAEDLFGFLFVVEFLRHGLTRSLFYEIGARGSPKPNQPLLAHAGAASRRPVIPTGEHQPLIGMAIALFDPIVASVHLH